MTKDSLIRNYGDYQNLYVYQKADVIYQLTYYYCETYMDRIHDRTVDQMIQSARSTKQNIAEGCTDFSTSMKMGIQLVNVAKGSLKELREDFEDRLKTQGKKMWEKDSEEVKTMRKIAKTQNDAAYYMDIARTRPPETIANMVLCLIAQTDYLLNKLLEKMSDEFENSGGFSERMYNWRTKKQ